MYRHTLRHEHLQKHLLSSCFFAFRSKRCASSSRKTDSNVKQRLIAAGVHLPTTSFSLPAECYLISLTFIRQATAKFQMPRRPVCNGFSFLKILVFGYSTRTHRRMDFKCHLASARLLRWTPCHIIQPPLKINLCNSAQVKYCTCTCVYTYMYL